MQNAALEATPVQTPGSSIPHLKHSDKPQAAPFQHLDKGSGPEGQDKANTLSYQLFSDEMKKQELLRLHNEISTVVTSDYLKGDAVVPSDLLQGNSKGHHIHDTSLSKTSSQPEAVALCIKDQFTASSKLHQLLDQCSCKKQNDTPAVCDQNVGGQAVTQTLADPNGKSPWDQDSLLTHDKEIIPYKFIDKRPAGCEEFVQPSRQKLSGRQLLSEIEAAQPPLGTILGGGSNSTVVRHTDGFEQAGINSQPISQHSKFTIGSQHQQPNPPQLCIESSQGCFAQNCDMKTLQDQSVSLPAKCMDVSSSNRARYGEDKENISQENKPSTRTDAGLLNDQYQGITQPGYPYVSSTSILHVQDVQQVGGHSGSGQEPKRQLGLQNYNTNDNICRQYMAAKEVENTLQSKVLLPYPVLSSFQDVAKQNQIYANGDCVGGYDIDYENVQGNRVLCNNDKLQHRQKIQKVHVCQGKKQSSTLYQCKPLDISAQHPNSRYSTPVLDPRLQSGNALKKTTSSTIQGHRFYIAPLSRKSKFCKDMGVVDLTVQNMNQDCSLHVKNVIPVVKQKSQTLLHNLGENKQNIPECQQQTAGMGQVDQHTGECSKLHMYSPPLPFPRCNQHESILHNSKDKQVAVNCSEMFIGSVSSCKSQNAASNLDGFDFLDRKTQNPFHFQQASEAHLPSKPFNHVNPVGIPSRSAGQFRQAQFNKTGIDFAQASNEVGLKSSKAQDVQLQIYERGKKPSVSQLGTVVMDHQYPSVASIWEQNRRSSLFLESSQNSVKTHNDKFKVTEQQNNTNLENTSLPEPPNQFSLELLPQNGGLSCVQMPTNAQQKSQVPTNLNENSSKCSKQRRLQAMPQRPFDANQVEVQAMSTADFEATQVGEKTSQGALAQEEVVDGQTPPLLQAGLSTALEQQGSELDQYNSEKEVVARCITDCIAQVVQQENGVHDRGLGYEQLVSSGVRNRLYLSRGDTNVQLQGKANSFPKLGGGSLGHDVNQVQHGNKCKELATFQKSKSCCSQKSFQGLDDKQQIIGQALQDTEKCNQQLYSDLSHRSDEDVAIVNRYQLDKCRSLDRSDPGYKYAHILGLRPKRRHKRKYKAFTDIFESEQHFSRRVLVKVDRNLQGGMAVSAGEDKLVPVCVLQQLNDGQVIQHGTQMLQKDNLTAQVQDRPRKGLVMEKCNFVQCTHQKSNANLSSITQEGREISVGDAQPTLQAKTKCPSGGKGKATQVQKQKQQSMSKKSTQDQPLAVDKHEQTNKQKSYGASPSKAVPTQKHLILSLNVSSHIHENKLSREQTKDTVPIDQCDSFDSQQEGHQTDPSMQDLAVVPEVKSTQNKRLGRSYSLCDQSLNEAASRLPELNTLQEIKRTSAQKNPTQDLAGIPPENKHKFTTVLNGQNGKQHRKDSQEDTKAEYQSLLQRLQHQFNTTGEAYIMAGYKQVPKQSVLTSKFELPVNNVEYYPLVIPIKCKELEGWACLEALKQGRQANDLARFIWVPSQHEWLSIVAFVHLAGFCDLTKKHVIKHGDLYAVCTCPWGSSSIPLLDIEYMYSSRHERACVLKRALGIKVPDDILLPENIQDLLCFKDLMLLHSKKEIVAQTQSNNTSVDGMGAGVAKQRFSVHSKVSRQDPVGTQDGIKDDTIVQPQNVGKISDKLPTNTKTSIEQISGLEQKVGHTYGHVESQCNGIQQQKPKTPQLDLDTQEVLLEQQVQVLPSGETWIGYSSQHKSLQQGSIHDGHSTKANFSKDSFPKDGQAGMQDKEGGIQGNLLPKTQGEPQQKVTVKSYHASQLPQQHAQSDSQAVDVVPGKLSAHIKVCEKARNQRKVQPTHGGGQAQQIHQKDTKRSQHPPAARTSTRKSTTPSSSYVQPTRPFLLSNVDQDSVVKTAQKIVKFGPFPSPGAHPGIAWPLAYVSPEPSPTKKAGDDKGDVVFCEVKKRISKSKVGYTNVRQVCTNHSHGKPVKSANNGATDSMDEQPSESQRRAKKRKRVTIIKDMQDQKVYGKDAPRQNQRGQVKTRKQLSVSSSQAGHLHRTKTQLVGSKSTLGGQTPRFQDPSHPIVQRPRQSQGQSSATASGNTQSRKLVSASDI